MEIDEMFKLEFSTSNAAFEDMSAEVARILRDAADRIEREDIYYGDDRPVRDINGNTVGKFTLTHE